MTPRLRHRLTPSSRARKHSPPGRMFAAHARLWILVLRVLLEGDPCRHGLVGQGRPMLVKRAPNTRLIRHGGATARAPAPAMAAEKGLVTDLAWGISREEQDQSVTALADLQARWAKISVNWRYAEPVKGGSPEGDAYLATVDRAVNLL